MGTAVLAMGTAVLAMGTPVLAMGNAVFSVGHGSGAGTVVMLAIDISLAVVRYFKLGSGAVFWPNPWYCY